MIDKAEHKTDGGGGGSSQHPKECKNRDKSLWWVGGFLLALVLLSIVLAII